MIKVKTNKGDSVDFNKADGFAITFEQHLTLFAGSASIAAFAPGNWSSVEDMGDTTQDKQFAEAVELVKLVDEGSFKNQDEDWQERAQALIDTVE